MATGITHDQARAALDEVERGRQRVIDEIDMPSWYWGGLAVGWIGLGIITDLQHPWLTVAATVAFGAVHASGSHSVIGGRQRTSQLSVRADIAGHRTPILVIGSLLALAALTILGALAASADGARHPVTAASIVVALLVVLGGPRLMASVRRRATQSSTTP